MNWKKSIIVMLLPMMILSGCSAREKKNETIYDRIHENYSNIKSYKASCFITVHAQSDHVYKAKLTYNKADNSMKLIYDNINISLKDNEAKITKDGITLKARSSDAYMPIFINTFFKYYYAGEESSVKTSKSNGLKTTVLECELSSTDANAASQKLWINTENALPVKSEIYKSDGSVYMEILFKSFTFTKD